jgi:HSP20 family protein
MLLRTWDPFSTLARFDAELDRTFRRSFAQPANGLVPPVEASKDGEDVVLNVELPGIDAANDVDVEVDGRRLIVKGERRDERSDDSDSVLLREFRYGSFRRTFRLPEGVTADDVEASYDKGLLTVRVKGANAAGAGPRKIAVQAAASDAIESDAA